MSRTRRPDRVAKATGAELRPDFLNVPPAELRQHAQFVARLMALGAERAKRRDAKRRELRRRALDD